MTEDEKVDKLFADSDASSDFKKGFIQSHFGQKILSFKPDFSFHEINGKDAESTVFKVQGVQTTVITDIVKASAETKNSAEQVVELLYALFPNLYEQAKLEIEMGLSPNEEPDL